MVLDHTPRQNSIYLKYTSKHDISMYHQADTGIHVCLYSIYTHIYTCKRMYRCMFRHRYKDMQIYIYLNIRAQTSTFLCIYTHTYIHTYIYIYAYIYTHIP